MWPLADLRMARHACSFGRPSVHDKPESSVQQVSRGHYIQALLYLRDTCARDVVRWLREEPYKLASHAHARSHCLEFPDRNDASRAEYRLITMEISITISCDSLSFAALTGAKRTCSQHQHRAGRHG